MRRAMVIFIITMIVTTLIPMISMIEANHQPKESNASKQMVTIFQD